MKKVLLAECNAHVSRIIRVGNELGYKAVAISSKENDTARHTLSAGEIIRVEPTPSNSETYLRAVVAAALKCGASAVHPGHGQFAGDPDFAIAVTDAGLLWIGPAPDAIRGVQDKIALRTIAHAAGAALLLETSLSKPSHANDPLKSTRAGQDAPTTFQELHPKRIRHIATHCLVDWKGTVAVIGVSDRTVQLGGGNWIEEAPAPYLSVRQVAQVKSLSTNILQAVGYRGTACCEFLVTERGDIFFHDIRAGFDIEQSAAEEVSGVDVVRATFELAEGRALTYTDVSPIGHSIGFRISSEGWRSSPQEAARRITRFALLSGPGIRLDIGHADGEAIAADNPLLGVLTVTGRDRRHAIQRASAALADVSLDGDENAAGIHRAVIMRQEFGTDYVQEFGVHDQWIDEQLPSLTREARARGSGAKPSCIRMLEMDI